MLRKRLIADMGLVGNGRDPKAICRDPEHNVRVTLPFIEGRASHTDPLEYFGPALSRDLRAEIQETWECLSKG